ncbi:hypothetical protein AA313_de0201516 [Arthrobotrys entomopaga]|nr:hypothetical protein AA313_de0201516 [Arthrobotrys entomopaga]
MTIEGLEEVLCERSSSSSSSNCPCLFPLYYMRALTISSWISSAHPPKERAPELHALSSVKQRLLGTLRDSPDIESSLRVGFFLFGVISVSGFFGGSALLWRWSLEKLWTRPGSCDQKLQSGPILCVVNFWRVEYCYINADNGGSRIIVLFFFHSAFFVFKDLDPSLRIRNISKGLFQLISSKFVLPSSFLYFIMMAWELYYSLS